MKKFKNLSVTCDKARSKKHSILWLSNYNWFGLDHDIITNLIADKGCAYHSFGTNEDLALRSPLPPQRYYRDIDLDSAIEYTVCNELEVMPKQIDRQNPIHCDAIDKWRLRAKACIDQLYIAIKNNSITKIVFPQGYVLEAAICRMVAANLGLQVFAIENSLHSDRLLWDDVSGITVNYNLSKNFFWKYKDSVKVEVAEAYANNYLRNIKHYKTLEHTSPQKYINLPPNKKVVLFLAQVLTDSSVLFNIYNFTDPVHIIEILAEYCIQMNYILIIKLHPKEISGNCILNTPLNRLTWRKLSASDKFIALHNSSTDILVDHNNEYDTFHLIKSSNVCVTINSMSGLEACLYGKPVINCGHASYSGLGFTSEAHDEGLLIYFLDRILNNLYIYNKHATLFFYIFLNFYCIKKDEAHLIDAIINTNRKTMSIKPLVSVIIPCFNAEKFVETALQSVLNQTYSNVEIIAIDDGSTDSTLEILKRYQSCEKITLLTHPNNENCGVSLTRRLGINFSKGEYVAFLDADDYFHTNKLEIQIDLLASHPSSILCHTGIKLIKDADTESDFESWFNRHEDVKEYRADESVDFLKSNHICNSSVVIKSEILKETLFESKQLFQFEDWVTWSLVSEHGLFLFTPQPLTNYRYHVNSATSNVFKSELVNLYSHLEFYLTLLGRTSSTKMKQACLDQTYSLLNLLYDQYAINTGDTGDAACRPFAENGDLQLQKHQYDVKIEKLLSDMAQMQLNLESMSIQLTEKDTKLREQDQHVSELMFQIEHKENVLKEVLNSLSWKISAPLRKILGLFRS